MRKSARRRSRPSPTASTQAPPRGGEGPGHTVGLTGGRRHLPRGDTRQPVVRVEAAAQHGDVLGSDGGVGIDEQHVGVGPAGHPGVHPAGKAEVGARVDVGRRRGGWPPTAPPGRTNCRRRRREARRTAKRGTRRAAVERRRPPPRPQPAAPVGRPGSFVAVRVVLVRVDGGLTGTVHRHAEDTALGALQAVAPCARGRCGRSLPRTPRPRRHGPGHRGWRHPGRPGPAGCRRGRCRPAGAAGP